MKMCLHEVCVLFRIGTYLPGAFPVHIGLKQSGAL